MIERTVVDNSRGRDAGRLTAIGVAVMALALGGHVLGQPPAARAQSGGVYEVSRSTVAGGAGTASGGAYVLAMTIGQPDTDSASGGAYSLGGGFWGGAGNLLRLFLPAIRR